MENENQWEYMSEKIGHGTVTQKEILGLRKEKKISDTDLVKKAHSSSWEVGSTLDRIKNPEKEVNYLSFIQAAELLNGPTRNDLISAMNLAGIGNTSAVQIQKTDNHLELSENGIVVTITYFGEIPIGMSIQSEKKKYFVLNQNHWIELK